MSSTDDTERQKKQVQSFQINVKIFSRRIYMGKKVISEAQSKYSLLGSEKKHIPGLRRFRLFVR